MPLNRKKREFLWALFFLAPSLLIIILFRILPIILAVNMSFYHWGIGGPERFVGLKNYLFALKDPIFWQSLGNNFWYLAFFLPLLLVIPLIIALLLNQQLKGTSFYQVIYYLPVITSLVAVSIVWKIILHPDRGLFNFLFSLLGLRGIRFLEDPRGIFSLSPAREFGDGPAIALLSLVIFSVWKGIGYNTLIYLAGLRNIPKDYYDAAKIDGANSFTTFFKVTLPLLSPTIFYILIMTTIVAFETFAPVWIMTGPPPGGPLGTTRLVMYYFYEQAFEAWKMGYGAAIAFLAFLFILVLTVFQKVFLEKKVHYE